jgi:MFS family permease
LADVTKEAAQPAAQATAPHPRPGGGPHFRIHTFDVFRLRDFRLLWAASIGSSGGLFMQQVVIGFLAYEITGSAFLTSLAIGLDTLPMLLGGPIGGLLVDTMDRRKLVAFAFAYQGLLALGFGVLVFFDLMNTWVLFAFVVAMGVSWIVIDPGRNALIAQIVPRVSMVNAFAVMSIAFGITRLAAPAIAGVVVDLGFGKFTGPVIALGVQGVLQLSAFVVAFSVQAERHTAAGHKLSHAFADIGESFRYVFKDRLIMGLLALMALVALFVMPFLAGLLPVMAAEVFKVGPGGLGVLFSAIGAGALVGNILLAAIGNPHDKGRLLAITTVLTVGFMALLGLNRSFAFAIPIILLLSASFMGLLTLINASIQAGVKDEMRGRMGGLILVTWGISPVGYVLSGVLAQELDAPTAILLAAAATAFFAILLFVRFRTLRHFE